MALRAAVVANPGSLAWLAEAAAAFLEEGSLRKYFNPIGNGNLTTLGTPSGLRGLLAQRRFPESIEERLISRPGTALELIRLGAKRTVRSDRIDVSLIRARNRHFDEMVAIGLRPDDDLLIAPQTAARASLARARSLGIRSVLSVPIAHHEFARHILQDEARDNPAWAGTLQYHDLPEWKSRRIEAELATADVVWVLSNFSRDTVVENGIDPDRVRVVEPGVDVKIFRPRQRLDDGIFRVLFVGQATQRKGIGYLIDGFEQAQIPDSELLIVGNLIGSPHRWLGERNIRHVNAVRHDRLPNYYAQADVFVAPSLVEGFMLAATEAMAMGLPAILTENTGVAGPAHSVVIPASSSEAIAAALKSLWADPGERQRLSLAGRKFALEHSWANFRTQLRETLGQDP